MVLDLFARKPVGWAMSFAPDSELTAKALQMAWELRGHPKQVMFHSDQGSHYTSRQYIARRLNFDYSICIKNRSSIVHPVSIFLRLA